jgi:cytoskeletal protein RodZ
MAPRVGQALRKARTERGIELSEVERVTKIRVKFLQAMEEDRWDALPAPAYARGFLGIYARYLDLDEQALLDKYAQTVEGERHEPIPESVIKQGVLRQTRPTRRTHAINWAPVGKVLAGLLGIVVVGLVIVGSIVGSDNGGGGNQNQHRGKAHGTKTTATTTATATATSTVPAGQVSVELRSTGTVWVCLVDDSGNKLVNSETLTANESRGPFSATGFDVTFGNGSVEMTVDGQPAPIPAAPQPIGYRITPGKVRNLDPASQPTCT